MSKNLTIIVALSALVAAFLVGCGSAKSQSSPSQPQQAIETTPAILTILTVSQGTVFVMQAGSTTWVEATVGMGLEPGDSLKTGDNSQAIITFFEGTTVELEPDTIIGVIDVAKANTGSTSIHLSQEVGNTISRVTKLVDSASSYDIKTPACVAAVKGSIMPLYVSPDGFTIVGNIEGTILVIPKGSRFQFRRASKARSTSVNRRVHWLRYPAHPSRIRHRGLHQGHRRVQHRGHLHREMLHHRQRHHINPLQLLP